MKKYFIYFILFTLFISVSYTRVEQRKAEGDWQRFEQFMKTQKIKFVRSRGQFLTIQMVNIKNALEECGIKGVLIIELCNKFGVVVEKLGIFEGSTRIPNVIKIPDIFARKENRSLSINFKSPAGLLKGKLHYYVDPNKLNLNKIRFSVGYKKLLTTTYYMVPNVPRKEVTRRKNRKKVN